MIEAKKLLRLLNSSNPDDVKLGIEIYNAHFNDIEGRFKLNGYWKVICLGKLRQGRRRRLKERRDMPDVSTQIWV